MTYKRFNLSWFNFLPKYHSHQRLKSGYRKKLMITYLYGTMQNQMRFPGTCPELRKLNHMNLFFMEEMSFMLTVTFKKFPKMVLIWHILEQYITPVYWQVEQIQ